MANTEPAGLLAIEGRAARTGQITEPAQATRAQHPQVRISKLNFNIDYRSVAGGLAADRSAPPRRITDERNSGLTMFIKPVQLRTIYYRAEICHNGRRNQERNIGYSVPRPAGMLVCTLPGL